MSAVADLDGKLRCGPSDCSPADSLSEQPRGAGQEMPLAAELVLATLLETARPGDAGPATVARNAAGRLDTPGGGHIPGDTPWTRRDAPAGARPRPRPTEAAARLPGGMLGACEAAHAATLQEQRGAPCALLFLTGCRSRAKHNQLRAAAVALLQRCALDKRAGTAQHCGNACCACIGRRTAGGCGRARRRRPTSAAAPAANPFCAAGAAGQQQQDAWSWPPSSRPKRGRRWARQRRRCGGLSACAVAARRPARAAALGARRRSATLAARAARRRRAPPRH
jgi:hypothetical protein